MNVEKAGMEDVDALVMMRLEYLREDFGKLGDRDADAIRTSLPAYFREHLGKDLIAYVIRQSGSIVSCAFLLIVMKPMSPAFMNGKTGIVMNVYTRPSFRKRGYAKRIMEALLKEAKEKALSVVELKATDSGYSLYRSVGFSDDPGQYHFMNWKNE